MGLIEASDLPLLQGMAFHLVLMSSKLLIQDGKGLLLHPQEAMLSLAFTMMEVYLITAQVMVLLRVISHRLGK